MKYLIGLLVVSLLLLSCGDEKPTPPQLQVEQKTAIEGQLRRILALNLNDSVRDFEVSSTDGDSLYSGIDWVKFDKRIKELAKDSLFSITFLDEYKTIAFGINLSLKNKEIEYNVGDVNPFFDANVWCDCQDYQGWEKRFRISTLRFIEGQAVVYFSIGKGTSIEAKFIKVGTKWRCTSWSTIKLP
jgi:hypothetical protein